jgi:hypothetical protein
MNKDNDKNSELEQYTPEEVVEASFIRTQVTADYEPNREEKQWEVIRDECDSGGALDERCNIVAASLGKGNLDVVAKRLSCGCLMVALDEIEQLNWDIGDVK